MHLQRQASDLQVFQDDEDLLLHPDLDYSNVEGLSSEVKERLGKVRPVSIVRPVTTKQRVQLSDFSLGCRKEDGRHDAGRRCCFV
jgi:tRNA U34 5-carboxymethylaminomethyl modifying enzyme MnmG/GidA